jgi:hypothetical protein
VNQKPEQNTENQQASSTTQYEDIFKNREGHGKDVTG